MGVYNNNNGNIIPLATNIRTQSTTFENFVTQEELIEGLSTKQDVIQYTTLPTASADNLGQIVQYIGATNASYTNGYFYKCVSDGAVDPTYSWEELYDFATKTELTDGLATKQDIMQYSDMPAASASYLDKICQYVGETNASNYMINGCFYKCEYNGSYYTWERITMPHYTKMPSNAELFTLPDGTIFETDGYWSSLDGCGGKYMIRDASQATPIMPITYNGATRYLIALNDNGEDYRNEINVARYGIRPISNFSSSDKATIAEANSTILESLGGYRNTATLKFPLGIFVFKNPINLNNQLFSIKGADLPLPEMSQNKTFRNFGTVLYFPYLKDYVYSGTKYAINIRGNISDVAVVGDSSYYNINIDRYKVLEEGKPVVTENETFVCEGIRKLGSSGFIQNVMVQHFTTGCHVTTGNTYVMNFFASQCKTGLEINNDIKCVGVYGVMVHTLLRCDGSISSTVQVRGDSCVNLINIKSGDKITIVDVDGDWCTEELITIGKEGGGSANISCLRLDGIHGRCSTLNCYDISKYPDGYDIRDIASTAGYGMIRILPQTALKNSYISVTGVGGHIFDNPAEAVFDKYWCPNILLTCDTNTSSSYASNINIIAPFEATETDILKTIQSRNGIKVRIDSTTNTYYDDNGTITKPTLS